MASRGDDGTDGGAYSLDARSLVIIITVAAEGI